MPEARFYWKIGRGLNKPTKSSFSSRQQIVWLLTPSYKPDQKLSSRPTSVPNHSKLKSSLIYSCYLYCISPNNCFNLIHTVLFIDYFKYPRCSVETILAVIVVVAEVYNSTSLSSHNRGSRAYFEQLFIANIGSLLRLKNFKKGVFFFLIFYQGWETRKWVLTLIVRTF